MSSQKTNRPIDRADIASEAEPEQFANWCDWISRRLAWNIPVATTDSECADTAHELEAMISTGRDKAGTRNRSNRPIAVGSKPLDELIHDLSNQMNVLTGAAWVLLTHTEHVERLDLLLQQVERATDLVCAMRDIVVLQKRIEDDGDREKTA